MKLFRVVRGTDPLLEPGTQITPTGGYKQFLDSIPEKDSRQSKVIIERALDKTWGSQGIRTSGLFAFKELKDALIFSEKIYHGNAVIYEISVSACDIAFVGDMNMLDTLTRAVEIGLENNHPYIFDAFCNFYWKQHTTFSPCWEYILKAAIIERIICSADDCGHFQEEFRIYESVERCPIYKQKLYEL